MTLDKLIKTIDIYLPGNRFDNEMKTMWLNEIEGKVFDEIEILDFKPAGNEVRYVKRDEDGKWVYKSANINKLPEEIGDVDDQDTAELEGTCVINDIDIYGIDPLNMNTCCRPCMRGRYELVPYRYPADKEIILIVPDRFTDLYIHYILAKMHQADSEIDNYNNEVLLFNASYQDYAGYKLRHYRG